MLRGLSPHEAVCVLLQGFGIEANRGALFDQLGPSPNADDLVHELGREGIQARWVTIDPSEMRLLECPTLLAKENGTYILVQREGKGFRVQAGTGDIQILTQATFQEAYGGCSFMVLSPALPDGSLWRRIFVLAQRYRKQALQIVAMAVGMQIFALLTPRLTGLLIDQVFTQGASSLFVLIILAMAVSAGYQAWIKWAQARTLLFVEVRLGLEVSQGFFVHLLRLPFPWLSSRDVGELSQGFYALSQARSFVTGDLVSSFLDGLMAVTYLGCMAFLQPTVTTIVVLVGLLYVAGLIVAGRAIRKRQAVVVDLQAKERGSLVELLNGIPIIKASGAEVRMEAEWARRFARRRAADLLVARQNLFGQAFVNHSHELFTIGVTLWCASLTLSGTFTLGNMLAFTMMMVAFHSSIHTLGSTYLRWLTLLPLLEKSKQILAEKPLPVGSRADTSPIQGPIQLRNLWFRYREDTPWVLQGITLNLFPGGKYLVQGPSGCGKSTLLKLLAGLYAPSQGQLTFGERTLEAAKGQVAYLPQFVRIFNATILENMRLLSGGVSKERLLVVARQTGLDELVSSLPMGYQTVLSLGGSNLSGGQRQLIAITAVLASPRPCILMDEALSNLDAFWRMRLMKCQAFDGKTIVMVGHYDGSEQPLSYDGFQRVNFSHAAAISSGITQV